VARLGAFDSDIRRRTRFSPDLVRIARFDRDLIGSGAPVVWSPSSSPGDGPHTTALLASATQPGLAGSQTTATLVASAVTTTLDGSRVYAVLEASDVEES
jgi:hypothetical protein